MSRSLIAVLLLCCSPAPVAAGGLFVPEVGAKAQARAGAFVAKADDPSALAHNAAGLAKLDGLQFTLDVNLVDFWLTYTRAGAYEPSMYAHDYETLPFPETEDISSPDLGFWGLQPVPLVAVSFELSDLHLAAGVFAPQGYPNRELPRDHNLNLSIEPAPAPQRYDVVSQEIMAVLPSMAIGYRVFDWLDVGVRLSWGVVSFTNDTAVWGVRNFAEAPERDGSVRVDVTDSFVPAAGVGLLARPHPRWEIGLSYSSPMKVDARGNGRALLGSDVGVAGLQDTIEPLDDPSEARCGTNGTVSALNACVELEVPQTLSLGVRFIVPADERERADVELDLRWEDWSAASRITAIVDGKSALTGIRLQPVVMRHHFRDVLSTRLGGSYGFDLLGHWLTARAGVAYDTAAAPEQWTRIDIDGAPRWTLAAGLAYEIGRFTLALGGGVVLEPERVVDGCKLPYGPTNESPGCGTSGLQTDSAARGGPDPSQPLEAPDEQVESPFNAGTYRSSYRIISIGLAARF